MDAAREAGTRPEGAKQIALVPSTQEQRTANATDEGAAPTRKWRPNRLVFSANNKKREAGRVKYVIVVGERMTYRGNGVRNTSV
ncbi:hypothetical protein E2C01_071073 [Portunus trituberculatus]|uniref:Uncharacterized protein n=1 Tax=Portunus trituberculatus TaxID=210409 RepID=A0A5B7HVZ8_PORTR|nr:hypothetical protein [Portunus trituberculatus]